MISSTGLLRPLIVRRPQVFGDILEGFVSGMFRGALKTIIRHLSRASARSSFPSSLQLRAARGRTYLLTNRATSTS